MTNPLSLDPAFNNARTRVQRGDLGQRLAVYAVARSKRVLDDPLTSLGLPLVDEIIATSGEVPISVTAASVGTPGGFGQWSVILAMPSGLRVSLDIAAGLGAAQSRELDLRVEWMGATQVILVDPTAVAVTVSTAAGHRNLSAEVIPIADALEAFANAGEGDSAWSASAGVIAAIRKSVESKGPVAIL